MKKGIDFIGVGCGALIVNDKNQVLLIKRSDKCQGGMNHMWSRPGGAVDFGEPVKQAIRREVKEELGIEIELFGSKFTEDDIRIEDGIKKHWVGISYFARIINGSPKIMEPEKHEKVEWFDLDNLPENLVGYTKAHIEELKKHIK